MQTTAISIALAAGKKAQEADRDGYTFTNRLSESRRKRDKRRQKMTDILKEIQHDKADNISQEPEFVGYLRRRNSIITTLLPSLNLRRQSNAGTSSSSPGRRSSGSSTPAHVMSANGEPTNLESRRQRNSVTVLKSISFLRRTGGGTDEDGRVDIHSLSLARSKSDVRMQRRRGSVFHSSESNADDYIEMPGEVWGTVKTGLLNEAFDRYCNIVLQRLGGDELVKDDDYMKNLGQESFKAARRASMNDFTTDANVVPHFLNVLKTTYEQNLSAQLHQDSLFIKLRRRLWILLSEPDSSMAAMIVSIFVLLTIFLSSTIFCMETMEEDSGNRGNSKIKMYDTIEYFCIAIFTAEYLGKCVSAPRMRAMLTPMNIIDLVAILPFYIEIATAGLDASFDTRIIRVVRLVRIFRMLKFGGRVMKLDLVTKAVSESADMLGMMLLLLAITITIFSTLVYYCERGSYNHFLGHYVRDGEFDRSPFSSIPYSFWWCVVTLTSVGYGDVVPMTLAGRIIATMAMVSSVIILALPISVIGTNFTQAWTEYKESMRDQGDSQSAVAQAQFSIKSPQLNKLILNSKQPDSRGGSGKSPRATPKAKKAFGPTMIQSFDNLLNEVKEQGNDVNLIGGQMGKVLSALDSLMTSTKQQFIIEETSRKMMMRSTSGGLRRSMLDRSSDADAYTDRESDRDDVSSPGASSAGTSSAGGAPSPTATSPQRDHGRDSVPGKEAGVGEGNRTLHSLPRRRESLRGSSRLSSVSSRMLMKQGNDMSKTRTKGRIRVYDPEMQESMEKIESLLTMYQALAATSVHVASSEFANHLDGTTDSLALLESVIRRSKTLIMTTSSLVEESRLVLENNAVRFSGAQER